VGNSVREVVRHRRGLPQCVPLAGLASINEAPGGRPQRASTSQLANRLTGGGAMGSLFHNAPVRRESDEPDRRVPDGLSLTADRRRQKNSRVKGT